MTPEEKCRALAEILEDIAQEVASECAIYAPRQRDLPDDGEIERYITYRTLTRALQSFRSAVV